MKFVCMFAEGTIAGLEFRAFTTFPWSDILQRQRMCLLDAITTLLESWLPKREDEDSYPMIGSFIHELTPDAWSKEDMDAVCAGFGTVWYYEPGDIDSFVEDTE